MKYSNSKLLKSLRVFFFIFISVICILSFFLYLDAIHYLDIDRITIKHGKFNISDCAYTFSLKTKFSHEYNLLLTIHDKFNDIEDIAYRNELETRDIKITIILKDNSGIIRSKFITQNNLEYCHYFGSPFSLCLLEFAAIKNKEYTIQLNFKINTDYYDKKFKKLYIQKDYDYAAMPWAKDFKKIFFYFFCISLSLVVVMLVYYFKKRNLRN